MSGDRDRPPLASELASPLPVSALLVLAVNDHLLKGAGVLPGWLTGKLSDFAGLFLFPIVLFVFADANARASARVLPRRAAATACAAATALLFAALKLHPALNAAISVYSGPIALDPSDLFALPMRFAAAAWLTARNSPAHGFGPQALRHALLVASSLACIATSPNYTNRNYPAWAVLDYGQHDFDCATVSAWVSKSGKQGVGISLALQSRGTGACEVAVARAVLVVDGCPGVAALALPAPVQVGATPSHLYLPFAFDNEASWNAEQLRAVLSLELAINGTAVRLQRQLVHRWPAPHVWDPPR